MIQLNFVFPQNDLLFFKVSPILIVNQYQTQIVFCREPIVYIYIRRSEINARQIISNRNSFTFDRSIIYDFILAECFFLHFSIEVAAVFSEELVFNILSSDLDRNISGSLFDDVIFDVVFFDTIEARVKNQVGSNYIDGKFDESLHFTASKHFLLSSPDFCNWLEISLYF